MSSTSSGMRRLPLQRSQQARTPLLETFVVKSASALGLGLCRFRGNAALDVFERAIDRFHRRLNNVDFVMRRNGELRVLKTVMRFEPKCIFDVGANEGEWTRCAAALSPQCSFHAFEIVPTIYRRFLQNTKALPNVTANGFGLSSNAGSIVIHLGRESGSSTACRIEGMRYHDEFYSDQVVGTTVRAADYMREHAIEDIDYVKIDVEGMDLQVIKGFGERIRSVRALQFEYGVFNIASHDLLSDFYRYLQGHGFAVGKIFPRHVHFSDYHFDMENFHGSNFVAVRNDQVSLIEALR